MEFVRLVRGLLVVSACGWAAAQAPPANPAGAKAAPPPPPGAASKGGAPSAPPATPPAAARHAPPTVADAADVAAFEAGLADAEHLLAARKWAPAQGALDALLAQHVDHEEVLLHCSEVQEDLERAAFGQTYVAPDIKTLIAGELQSYDPRSGKIKLRYKRDPKAASAAADEEDQDEESEVARLLREL